MKMYFYGCLMGVLALFVSAMNNRICAATVAADHTAATAAGFKTEKKGFSGWLEKRAVKMLSKKIAKLQKRYGSAVDFNDPVEKWLWYGVVGCVAGLVLSVLAAATGGVLWGLSGLAWTVGVVCLIVWFLKREGAI